MRILGIDPGSRVTGYGLIEGARPAPRAVDYGVLRPDSPNDPIPDRLLALYRALRALLQLHRPDLVSVETAFYHKSARSTLVLGQVRGVLILAAREEGIVVEEYSPREIKLAVTGRGGAAKEQVQLLVRAQVGLRDIPPLDAADALGAALCAWHRRLVTGSAAAAAVAVPPAARQAVPAAAPRAARGSRGARASGGPRAPRAARKVVPR